MKKASELSLPANLPLVKALRQLSEDPAMAAGSRTRIHDFLEMLGRFTTAREVMPPSKLTEFVLKEVAYIPYLRESLGIEAQSKIDNLKELLASMEDYESGTETPTLEEYLAQVSLLTDLDTKKESSAVTLMTLHLSKGLEFPVVFIAGVEEGLIPHSQSNCNTGELEEERRLLYVGMTRARKKLYLMNAMCRRLAGLTQSNRESRFVEEIPKHLINCRKLKVVPRHIPQPTRLSALAAAVEKHATTVQVCGCTFRNGDKVCHQLWGMGVIEKTDGRGQEQKLIVQFPGVGRKKLLARMANLTRA